MQDCSARVRGHRGIFMIDVGMRRTGRQARICVVCLEEFLWPLRSFTLARGCPTKDGTARADNNDAASR